MSGLSAAAMMTNGQNPAVPAGTFKDELDDFERFALESLVRNEWGLKVATLNRLMCKYTNDSDSHNFWIAGFEHAAERERAAAACSLIPPNGFDVFHQIQFHPLYVGT